MTTPYHPPLSPADAVAVWMAHYGLSETAVATATGLSVNTVTRLLRGSQPVNDTVADALATATGVPAERWLDLQRQHAVRTAAVDNALAVHGPGRAAWSPRALGHTTKGFVHVQFTTEPDQEDPMSQPPADQELQIPLHNGTTLHRLAELWADRIGLSNGPQATASVLIELATVMLSTGTSYLGPSDLETLAGAVRGPAEGS